MPIVPLRLPRRAARRLFWLGAVLAFGGCVLAGNSGCSKKHAAGVVGEQCPTPEGPVHGKGADDRVDVTAAEAWPGRKAMAALSGADVAAACAAYAACVNDPPQGRYLVREWCEGGGVSYSQDSFALGTAERAVPAQDANETFPFFVRTVLSLAGDCAAIRGVLTKRVPAITCQEDGCYSLGNVGSVTCSGDIATLLVDGEPHERDCGRADATCSATSETGCTDRTPTKCTSPANDRCDGDVKLGCDHCGLVSFHDCSWNGGHCEETADGAKCVPPGNGSACFGLTADCNGDRMTRCIGGMPQEVDCAALGMRCQKLPTGIARLDGGGCGLSPCETPMCVTAASVDGG